MNSSVITKQQNFSQLSKLKAFADNTLNASKNMNFVSDRIENIVGKGENAGYPHFLFFAQYFKSFLPKSWDCVVKS